MTFFYIIPANLPAWISGFRYAQPLRRSLRRTSGSIYKDSEHTESVGKARDFGAPGDRPSIALFGQFRSNLTPVPANLPASRIAGLLPVVPWKTEPRP